MKVSVILPVFNAEKTIKRCISSLLNQKMVKEIIVVNDNSIDDTLEKIKSFQSEKIIIKNNEKNLGTSKSKNKGADLAKENILFFAEADAYYDKNHISKIVPAMKNEKVAGAIGKCLNYNKKTLISELRLLEKKISYKDYEPISAWVIKKSVFEEVGRYDESLKCGEDVDLGMRMKKAGYDIVYVLEAIWYHKEPETLKELIQRNIWQGEYVDDLHLKHETFPKGRFFDLSLFVGLITLPFGIGVVIITSSILLYLLSKAKEILYSLKMNFKMGLLFPFYLLIKRLSVFIGLLKRISKKVV